MSNREAIFLTEINFKEKVFIIISKRLWSRIYIVSNIEHNTTTIAITIKSIGIAKNLQKNCAATKA